MDVGFIGAGNLASALIAGAVSAGTPPGCVHIIDAQPATSQAVAEKFGVRQAADLPALAARAGLIFVAVKPKNLPELLPGLKAELARLPRRVVVSLAAGRDLAFLMEYLGADQPLARVMPNLNAAVGAGMAAVCGSPALPPEGLQAVLDFFNALGLAIELQEEYFPIFSALAGAGPAYVYLFIDTLARAAVRHGLPKPLALRVAAQTVLGGAKTLLASPRHPWDLIDSVCSPGGLTIEGLCSLQADRFESAIVRAIDAVMGKEV
jgi:pyrroline-5-carboxylate reductase